MDRDMGFIHLHLFFFDVHFQGFIKCSRKAFVDIYINSMYMYFRKHEFCLTKKSMTF